MKVKIIKFNLLIIKYMYYISLQFKGCFRKSFLEYWQQEEKNISARPVFLKRDVNTLFLGLNHRYGNTICIHCERYTG